MSAAFALGAQPDAELARSLPREVRAAVTYGRPTAQPRLRSAAGHLGNGYPARCPADRAC